MALEPKIAGEKWCRFHRDERVGPRSLIKSNWETSIWYRVYSPEKINQAYSKALVGVCGKGAAWSQAGRRTAWPVRTQSLTILPSWSQGKVSQQAKAGTTEDCLKVVSEQGEVPRAWWHRPHLPSWTFGFFFYPKICAISYTSSPPDFPSFCSFCHLPHPSLLPTSPFSNSEHFCAFSMWLVFDGRGI